PIGQRLHDILAGRIFFGLGIGWLAVVGLLLAAVFVARRHRGGWALLLALILFLVLSHAAAHLWSNEIAVQLGNRGLGYAGLIALFPVAVAIAALAQRFRGAEVAGMVAALVFAVTIVVALPGPHHSGIGDAHQLPAAVPAM